MLVAGVDACKAGWVVVLVNTTDRPRLETAAIGRNFGDVLAFTQDAAAVAVDIPIGLPDVAETGGREAEKIAREMLKPHRGSSVFPSPPRAVLSASDYAEAVRLAKQHSRPAKGMTRQAFGIVPKIREADQEMTAALQERVVETHPELIFRAMNSARPLEWAKASAAGVLFRIRLLVAEGLRMVCEEAAYKVGNGAKPDDVLDATAAAWTADRFARGEAVRIPQKPDVDVRGLRMEMWY